MALGEKVFLFLWAVVSSAKDIIVDYTTEALHYVSQKPQRGKKKKPTQITAHERRRKAYFRRLRHQMGVYTPEKDKNNLNALTAEQTPEDDLDNIVAKLEDGLAEDDKQSKLEDLESQLMDLKQQLAFLSGKPSPLKPVEKKTPLSQPPSMMNNHVNIAEAIQTKTSFAPPPPPPPPPMFIASPQTPKKQISAPVLKVETYTKGMGERSLSLADIVRSAKGMKLRPTNDVNRSPQGTPKKSGKPVGGFQNELFAAIKNKFKTLHDDENKNNSSDSEDDSFDTPPKIRNKENAEPNRRAASPLPSRSPFKSLPVNK